jgi:DMSO/TMAO reductase YedYZ molybdopterin-dependent catalytic subunit
MEHSFLRQHSELSRRYFIQAGVVGATVALPGATMAPPGASQGRDNQNDKATPKPKKREKAGALDQPYFTPADQFRDVSRGTPLPHSLPEPRLSEAGLTRDRWHLEVLSDPEQPATLARPLSKADGTALDFAGLMALAQNRAVRFPKVMTCLNVGCPLGMGLWEGVPLRDVIWMTRPTANLRRVFYYGYHNDDPKQMFRSSLPIGRVLEDPFDTPPVILCYKLNGQWLDSERGGPVRIVVPEAYGFKSIKWLSHVILTNLPHANDTYAEKNNDIDSPLKSFSATLMVPSQAKAYQPLAFSGYAQVGIAGLSKVQVAIEPKTAPTDDRGPTFADAPWVDADLLPPPARWDALEGGVVPPGTFGFDDQGRPSHWPMRFCNAHWAYASPGLPPGDYVFRCRAVDQQGSAQPMPRPFQKSGHAAIEAVPFQVA